MGIKALKTIMTPQHPLWEEFSSRLESAVGACDQSKKKPRTRNVLHALNQRIQARKAPGPPIDVEASLAWFEEEGGHCDCDVLLFVVGT
jgi:hypothetical protein